MKVRANSELKLETEDGQANTTWTFRKGQAYEGVLATLLRDFKAVKGERAYEQLLREAG